MKQNNAFSSNSISLNTSFEYYKDLLYELTRKEIIVRYKNYYLGYLWSLLNPLAHALVYLFAFKVVLNVKTENYALFLIAGLFPWQWFASTVSGSASIFISNAGLIKKTMFPKDALIYAKVTSEFIHFLLTIPVLICFLFAYDKYPTMWWFVGLPLLFVSQFFLISGLAFTVATLNLFFRDLERLVAIIMNFLFFLTPIIYTLEAIPEKYRLYILLLNPASSLILTYKALFLDGVFAYEYYLLSLAYSLIWFAVGFYIFNKLKWKLAEAI